MNKNRDIQAPQVIPPRSVVKLVRSDASTPAWKREIGREFRIGYYRPNDGLDCIWLVNEAGEYEQSVDRKTILRHFEIVSLSDEKDLLGHTRPELKPLRPSRRAAPSRAAS